MTLVLRRMQVVDIPAVGEIDQLSFNPPWAARSYAFEITESTYSHMCVLEVVQGDEDAEKGSFLRRLRRGFSAPNELNGHIVGYGGLWSIAGEGHISTIATHPDYRGRGWGEILLVGMLEKAIVLNSDYIVLEVRVSNTVAQNLYKKYDFEIQGVKPRYYAKDGEDAYDMRVPLADNLTYIAKIHARFQEIIAQYGLQDLYTPLEEER